MKNISIRQKLLVCVFLLIVLLVGLSIQIDRYANTGVTDDVIKQIERKLFSLQKETDKFLELGFSDISKPNFDNVWSQSMSNKGVVVYVIDSLSPVYWSESLPVSFKELQSIDSVAQYVNFGNGWYVAQSRKFGSYKALSLILIQNDYPYQNKYLENTFNREFNFPPNSIISSLGSDVGIPVKGKDNNPIFVISTDVNFLIGTDVISNLVSPYALFVQWLILILILVFICAFFYKRKPWLQVFAFVILLGLRIGLFYLDITSGKYIYLFSPMLYADSTLLPSLGDLLLHSLFSFIFLFLLYSSGFYHTKRYSVLNLSILLAYTLSVIFFMDYTIDSLAINSNITLKIYQISSVSVFSFISYFIIVVLFSQVLILMRMLKKSLVRFPFYTIWILFFLLLVLAFTTSIYPLAVVILCISIYFVADRKIDSNYLAIITFLFSFYLSYLLIENNEKRDDLMVRNKGQSLFAETDPIAEMLLRELEVFIEKDPYIVDKLKMENRSLDEFSIGLTDRYFRGYFHRYDFHYQIVKCHSRSEDKERIDEEISTYGKLLDESSHFFFMDKHSGKISYLGQFSYPDISDTLCLYINLESKAEIESKGYPDLLIDEKNTAARDLEDYSYAKYSNGTLVAHYGEFDYSIEMDMSKIENNSFSKLNGYRHFYHLTDKNNLVIVSRPQLTFSDIISMFSYSFVFVFLVLFILLAYLSRFDFDFRRISYQWRISAVILGGITIALTLMTVAVLYYTMWQTEERNIESIHEKMKSVIVNMEQNFFYNIEEFPKDPKKLEAVLVNLSNVYNTDFNLYNTKGKLLASSREEIFDKKLQGTLMNRNAFYTMSVEKAPKYTHTENIGNLKFYSAYAIYYNKYEEVIAYINLPYFLKQSVFREELMYLIGTVFNIYIIMIIIGVSVSMFVSGQITRPLNKVRLQMRNLDLSGKSEPINYKRDDELGELIRDYNRMIVELKDSAQKLAHNERESAWREMARQIAHEIKNPLTPMKLGLQHALRMKKSEREGWEEKLDEVAHSVLEQIEVLAKTASEFSSFAQINKEQFSPIDLDKCIRSGINLFSNFENVKIDFITTDTEKYVYANEEQLKRVFTNFIKNGIEATLNEPKITITVLERNNNYLIRIKDNGEGIREDLQKKLFQPNFTTKSGGTGLGLAISKSIIETFGGEIVFIKGEKGACFELSIPIYKKL